MWLTKAGNLLTGTGNWTKASGPSSSRRFIQAATVAEVTKNALAVCPSDQPQAGLEFEDVHPLDRHIPRTLLRGNTSHAGKQDANLLVQLGQFGFQAVVLGNQSKAAAAAVGRPATSVGEGLATE